MLDLRNPFVLREDLYACEGTLIVPQGEIITPSLLEKLEEKSPGHPNLKTFLKETDLLHDFRAVMDEENYHVIFDREELVEDLLDLLGEIYLTPQIINELELFKLKDYYTYRHILITTVMTMRMAHDFYGDRGKALLAASTALTHDFGKSRIPLDILQSDSKLDYEEFMYIHEHPWIGFLLLTYYTGNCESPGSLVSFNHHEKINGTGYPRGIKVEDTITQFVTINDMFDALISHRPYRMEPFNVRGALDYLCDEVEFGCLNVAGVKLLISYNRHITAPLDSITYSHDHLGYRPPDEFNNYSSHEDYEDPDDPSGTAGSLE